MLLQFSDGTQFAAGAAPYSNLPVTSKETYPRINLQITVSDLKTSAFVDTGGVFFVCSPEIGEYLGLEPNEGAPVDKLRVRGSPFDGALHRVEVTLDAAEGEKLTIGVTAFVPILKAGQEWFPEFPCVLGLYGCLERLRFAVDPSTDTFYFGELS